jgi:hypothetical protein
MGLPKKNFEKKISFPKKCVAVWVFDGTAYSIKPKFRVKFGWGFLEKYVYDFKFKNMFRIGKT